MKIAIVICLLLGTLSSARAEEAVMAVAGTSAGTLRQDARVVEQLPDFTSFDSTKERKVAFFTYLKPVVDAENGRIRKLRQRLLSLEGKSLTAEEESWLRDLFYHYRVPYSQWDNAIQALKRRVDVVPAELALAQAASESGWGTSRFARMGNNLFGQWCFRKGCGLVPDARADDAGHEVQVFATPAASVRAYMHNLNSGKAYGKFRSIRVGLHRMGKTLSASVLAVGLHDYSQRGQAYVDEIRMLVATNRTLMQGAGN